MKERIHYNRCPVCGSANIQIKLEAKDHTVSGEQFTINECGDCTLCFTQDIPSENQIAPYYQSEDYISHSDTSKGLVNRLYHRVRKHTIQKKRKIIERFTGKSAGNILDVGCGTGAFLFEMKNHGWDVTGLEPDPGARDVALRQYGLQLETPDKLYQIKPGSFQAITLWHVLEHVHELHRYIDQLKSLLTDDGKIFIAVPNYTSKDAAAYGTYWAAWDVPRHLYHFSPRAMERLMNIHHLKISHYLPMWYDSIYISLMSSRYRNGDRGKKGRTDWLSAAWNGFRSNLAALGDNKKCSSVIYVVHK